MPDEPAELAPEPFDMTPPAAGDDEPVPLRRRSSRRRRILLGSLLAVGLAGAGALGTTTWRVTSQKDASLSVPELAAGLRRDDSGGATSTSDYLRNALAAKVRLDETMGVVYADPADRGRSVLLFGGTTLLWSPERDLDAAMALVSDETGAVTSVREVPAGRLGGVMKCGSTRTEGGDLAVCGWADHGSVAVGLFPDRSPDESAPLLRKLRESVQTRR